MGDGNSRDDGGGNGCESSAYKQASKQVDGFAVV
jgi:hypothetical protein